MSVDARSLQGATHRWGRYTALIGRPESFAHTRTRSLACIHSVRTPRISCSGQPRRYDDSNTPLRKVGRNANAAALYIVYNCELAHYILYRVQLTDRWQDGRMEFWKTTENPLMKVNRQGQVHEVASDYHLREGSQSDAVLWRIVFGKASIIRLETRSIV